MITWLRSFFIHLGVDCKKLVVFWRQIYRFCRSEDEATNSLLGLAGLFNVELSFKSSQALTHISRHRQEVRLTIDGHVPSIEKCESCLVEGYRTREIGRHSCEDPQDVGHERTLKR